MRHALWKIVSETTDFCVSLISFAIVAVLIIIAIGNGPFVITVGIGSHSCPQAPALIEVPS